MSKIRVQVYVLFWLTLNGVLCDVSLEGSKHATKAADWRKVEKKNEKRDSSDSTILYSFNQKDEPFHPLLQYHYHEDPLRATASSYIASAATPQLSYSKPDTFIAIGGGSSNNREGTGSEGSTVSASNIGGIQYASSNSYKNEGGIHYAPSTYKSTSSSGGGIQYASSAYRGPFVSTSQPTTGGQVKVHSGQIYVPPASSVHSAGSQILPWHFGAFEQQLPPQHHQQNQYDIVYPAEYVRHYQQNLAAPFPMHMMPLLYNAAPTPLTALKDQPFKPNAVHYISLAPQSASSSMAAPSSTGSGPTIITQFIPLYGPVSQHHQQFQQQLPASVYFGSHHQQTPNTFAYAALSAQPQTIQIAPKHQILGPIQVGAVGTAATVPIISLKPIAAAQQQQQQQQLHQHQHQHQHQQQQQNQQQLQQPIHHFHEHQHPSATSYTRYSQSLSGATSSQVPTSETSSASTLKLGPLYPTSSSTSSGNLYATSNRGAGGGSKMSYTYASDAVGPVYTHPGAIHYGTHLYHPPTKIVEIGSNRVTAGSAAIAGVVAPAYHSHQQSPSSNILSGGSGGKFS